MYKHLYVEGLCYKHIIKLFIQIGPKFIAFCFTHSSGIFAFVLVSSLKSSLNSLILSILLYLCFFCVQAAGALSIKIGKSSLEFYLLIF